MINFTASYLLTGLVLLFLSAFVYIKNPKRHLNRIFAVYLMSTSWWALFSIPMINAHTEAAATFWDRVCLMGTVFIPTTFLHFNFILLRLEEKCKKILKACYIISAIYLFLDWTPYFVQSTSARFPAKYFTDPGIFYHIFIIYFFTATLAGIVLLFWKSRITARGAYHRQQVTYLFWAFIIGYAGGGLNYNLVYNIGSPYIVPFGNYAMTLSLALITYTIIRYRLIDARIIISRAVIFIFVYVPILLIPIVLALWRQQLLENVFGKYYWLIPTIVEGIIAIVGLSVYLCLQTQAEHQLLKEEYEHEEALKRLSDELIRIETVDKLSEELVIRCKSEANLEYTSVYFIDKQDQKYKLQCQEGLQTYKAEAVITGENALVKYLESKQDVVIYEESEHENRQVSEQLKMLNGVVSVPILQKDELLGILILGRKKNARLYTPIELMAFKLLSRQVALEIVHINFVESMRKIETELNEARRMRDISHLLNALGHEIKNALQEIITIIYDLTIDDEILDHLSKNKKVETWYQKRTQSLMEHVVNLQRISAELSKFMRKEDVGKMMQVNIEEIIQRMDGLLNIRNSELKHMDFEVKADIKALANPVLLQTVFYNMINNSYEAILKEANLRKTSEEEQRYKGKIEIEALEKQDKVHIHVRDNGFGMDDRTKKEIFTPMFTTKGHLQKKQLREDEREGIGMYKIREIINALDGSLQIVHSRQHEGTDFLIILKKEQIDTV